jgi:hypothetical protein
MIWWIDYELHEGRYGLAIVLWKRQIRSRVQMPLYVVSGPSHYHLRLHGRPFHSAKKSKKGGDKVKCFRIWISDDSDNDRRDGLTSLQMVMLPWIRVCSGQQDLRQGFQVRETSLTSAIILRGLIGRQLQRQWFEKLQDNPDSNMAFSIASAIIEIKKCGLFSMNLGTSWRQQGPPCTMIRTYVKQAPGCSSASGEDGVPKLQCAKRISY